MIKFINKLVIAVDKMKNFFYFIQALQAGFKAFQEEWAKLTGKTLEEIEAEIKKEEIE
jgi:uncharacterized membrane protein (DUF106 family)